MHNLSKLKVAIVYDHLNTPFGGAELVLKNLFNIFPQADLISSIHNPLKTRWLKNNPPNKIKTSFLQKIPILNRHHRLASLLMPIAFEQLNLSQYQLIISVSSYAAKGIISTPKQLHINYLLTPTRFLYSHQEDYFNSIFYLKLPIVKQLAQLAFNYLKLWDKIAVWRPDKIIAISQLVANRCLQYCQRPADGIIYPPVKNRLASTDCSTLQTISDREQTPPYLLIISRLVAYKKIDLVIKACFMAKKNLIIIGNGPAKKHLQKLINQLEKQPSRSNNQTKKQSIQPTSQLTTATVRLIGEQSEQVKNSYLANCQALILPGIEDFGIVALEANIFGKPVILHQASGSAEVAKGISISQLSVNDYLLAFKKLDKQHQHYCNSLIKQQLIDNALLYQEKNFQKQFFEQINSFWQKHAIL